MMTAWLVRAGRNGESREDYALENNVAGTGFAEVGDLTAATTRPEIVDSVRAAYPGLLRGGTGAGAGALKAIGTAYRREDFTLDAFFDYWRDVHAPISARAPGLGAYVVTETGRKLVGVGGAC